MGCGIPQMPQAVELLATLRDRYADDIVFGYDIDTESPLGYGGHGRTSYWRSTYYPAESRQTFTIEPVFRPLADAADKADFSRKFELRSRTPWCLVPQESFYLRGEQSARVFVEYDESELTEPGLYIGIVEALHDGVLAFQLVNTIVVPYEFDAADGYLHLWKNRRVDGWKPDRWFVAVPPGASAMRIMLRAPEGERSKASIERIFNPHGRQFRVRTNRLDTDAGRREVEWVATTDLLPGVWEIPVIADRPDETWPYELQVGFSGLHAEPAKVTDADPGRPSGEIIVTNQFPDMLPARLDGAIEGLRLYREDEFKGLDDTLEYSLSLDGRFNRVRIVLEMTKADYAQTTDIGVEVLDAGGEQVHFGAFDGRIYEAEFGTKGNSSLKVRITGGFAVADDQRKTPIVVKIDQLFAAPPEIAFTQNGDATVDLVPSVPMRLAYKASSEIEDIPDKLRPVGYLRARDRGTNAEVLRIPVDIGA
jgi:hypothetical protein